MLPLRSIEIRSEPIVSECRCLRSRFRPHDCKRCQSVCPEGAIETLAGSVRVEPSRCSGCMLCVAACPTETLQAPGKGFLEMVEGLSEASEPVLGCENQARAAGHERVHCLGRLALEHLVALRVFVDGPVTLNATACADCPRGAALGPLKRRMKTVARLWLGEGVANLRLAEDPGDLRFEPVIGDRRWLFRSLEKGIARRVSAGLDRRSVASPAGALKTCPEKTRLLAAALQRLPKELNAVASEACLPRIRLTESCDECGRCASVCPTGALVKRTSDGQRSLATMASRCNACGICMSFCGRDGIEVEPGWILREGEELGA